MKACPIALALALSALAGCSTITTRYDYDTAFDFSSLKSYAWLEPTGDVGINDLNVRRVRSAVDRVLGAKGYVKTTEAPDFHVTLHGATRSRVSVTERHYGRRGWYGHSGVDVYEYEEGMLAIDVLDGSKKLVWQGIATKVLSTNPTPEKIEQTINLAVDKILEKFPPTPAKS